MIFMVVDLPEPFGPRYPVTTPGRAEKLTLSTARLAENRLDTFRSSSMWRLLGSRGRVSRERVQFDTGQAPWFLFSRRSVISLAEFAESAEGTIIGTLTVIRR